MPTQLIQNNIDIQRFGTQLAQYFTKAQARQDAPASTTTAIRQLDLTHAVTNKSSDKTKVTDPQRSSNCNTTTLDITTAENRTQTTRNETDSPPAAYDSNAPAKQYAHTTLPQRQARPTSNINYDYLNNNPPPCPTGHRAKDLQHPTKQLRIDTMEYCLYLLYTHAAFMVRSSQPTIPLAVRATTTLPLYNAEHQHRMAAFIMPILQVYTPHILFFDGQTQQLHCFAYPHPDLSARLLDIEMNAAGLPSESHRLICRG